MSYEEELAEDANRPEPLPRRAFETVSALERLMPVVRALVGATKSYGSGTSIREILPALVFVNRDDIAGLHRAYARLIMLSDDAVAEVRALSLGSRAVTKASTARAETATGPVLAVSSTLKSNSVHSKVGVFESMPLATLESLCAVVTASATEAPDYPAAVAEMYALVEELESELRSSQLSEDLQEQLRADLERFRTSLAQYDLFAQEPLNDASGRLLLSLLRTKAVETLTVAPVVYEKLGRLVLLAEMLRYSYVTASAALPHVEQLGRLLAP